MRVESPRQAERTERERSTFLCVRDDAGRMFEFHGLRHTFLTNLARAGVHPKIAQQLARHSTIVLTMDRYSHVTLGEQSDALAMLPGLDPPAGQAARATGTDGASKLPVRASGVLASCLARKGGGESNSVHSRAVNAGGEGSDPESQNTEISADSSGESGVRLQGLEPWTYGLKVRCSTN